MPEQELCVACGVQVIKGSKCPRAMSCPTCGAGPGRPCKRPSGHRAASLHVARAERAEAIDARRGITYT